MSGFKCEGGYLIPYGKACPECGATDKERCGRPIDYRGKLSAIEEIINEIESDWPQQSPASKELIDRIREKLE